MDSFLEYQLAILRDQYRLTTSLPITIQASLLFANYPFYPNGGFCGGAYPPLYFDLPIYYPSYYGGGHYRGGHHYR